MLLSVVGEPPQDADCGGRDAPKLYLGPDRAMGKSGLIPSVVPARDVTPSPKGAGSTIRWSWRPARPDRCRHHAARSRAEAGGRPAARYAVPDFHIASRIVARLRLTATNAFFIDVRFAILRPHAFKGDMTRARPRILAAASKSMTRPRGSPALLIRPAMSVLPDCHLRGGGPARECLIFCLTGVWSVLPEREQDDDDFQGTSGRTSEGLRAA